MTRLINNENLQHYTNKMCNADNRKVGSKSLPTALNDIDLLIDEMKVHFDEEYGSLLDMKMENNTNTFSVGSGIEIDRRDDVENSFSDVELSGNTVVNLIQEKSYLDWHILYCGRKSADGVFIGRGPKYASQAAPNNTTSTDVCCKIISKNNSVYTLIFDAKVIEGTSSEFTIVYNGICIRNTAKIKDGRNVILIRSDDSQNGTFQIYEVTGNNNESDINIRLTNIVILEGDWTNRPIPRYFQGMKSIGEREDGNQVIISSTGRNICPVSEYSIYDIPIGQNMNGYRDTIIYRNIPVKPNTKYAIYVKEIIGAPNQPMRVHTFRDKIPESGLTHVDCYNSPNRIREYTINQNIINGTITTESDAKYINLTTGGFSAESTTITYVDLQVVEGSTIGELEPYKEDKKEILLNKPLRGLPNGIRDTIEKINGEWKIVRRCGEAIINGSLTYYNHSTDSPDFDEYKVYDFPVNNIKQSTSISDRFPQTANDRIICVSKLLYIRFGKEKQIDTLEKCQQWFETNPTKVIYELETPIIEDISPITLQCWKNGTISIDEVLPVETTHTVALNKPAQIKRNIEELTELRNRVKRLEDTLDTVSLDQALQFQLLNHSINLDK